MALKIKNIRGNAIYLKSPSMKRGFNFPDGNTVELEDNADNRSMVQRLVDQQCVEIVVPKAQVVTPKPETPKLPTQPSNQQTQVSSQQPKQPTQPTQKSQQNPQQNPKQQQIQKPAQTPPQDQKPEGTGANAETGNSAQVVDVVTTAPAGEKGADK